MPVTWQIEELAIFDGMLLFGLNNRINLLALLVENVGADGRQH